MRWLREWARKKIVDASFCGARRRHGEILDRAHAALMSLDPRDPAACKLVQRICDSSDPGEAALKWYKKDRPNEYCRAVDVLKEWCSSAQPGAPA